MIPVLIIPTLNGWDRIPALLHSLDHRVERIVIVDNQCSGRRLGNHSYIRPISNLGFAGSINTAIAQTPNAEWWMWAGDDITFGRDDLAYIADLMETASGPRLVTGDRKDERLLRFAYAALNRACIEAVGLLDEWTFYPAYFDDDDYDYRCRLGGVEWIEYNGTIAHQRSATIQDATYAAANARTFPMNRARYAAKWGGLPGSETYPRPWNLPVPLSFTPPDIAGRAARQWS